MSVSARTSSKSVAGVRELVVGTVYSESSLMAATALGATTGVVDLLELRVDHFARQPGVLDPLVTSAALPFIVTARSSGEGGHGGLDVGTRRALYDRFMPAATYVDLELSSLEELPTVAEDARQRKGGLVASHHDFKATPSLEELRELAGRAADAGAAIFKVAVRTEETSDVTVLLELLATETRLPLAVMGMGRLGRLSRLLAAALGSRLNYGYLGAVAQVPGQWPAPILRARLDELRLDAPLDARAFGLPAEK